MSRSTLHGTSKWKRESAAYLRANEFCASCLRAGRRTKAVLVHHKRPHRGDVKLFWDRKNWEGRCRTCHDDAIGPERTGRPERYRGARPDGTPLDPSHPWNGRGGVIQSGRRGPSDRLSPSHAQARFRTLGDSDAARR
jgi:5-methylcytosine-specific restriction protein A